MSDPQSTDLRNAPAYPVPEAPGHDEHFGLTKRELFAAMAMQAMCTPTAEDEAPDTWDMNCLANAAVEAADALLTALKETP